ncbi:hypothetical protein [Acinetobacter baumannii]
MTGPIPYGLHVISGELTDQDTDRILSVIHRFLSYKEAAQLENLKQVYDLPDGGYFIVQHLGGLFRIIADKQEPEKFKFINDGLVKTFIPMFFSGVVEKATVRQGEKVKLKITEQCRHRLSRQLERTIPKGLELERFTIEQSYRFPEFAIQGESVFKRTQYLAHNPGWYSGTMAKLHQFVGGYGIQEFESLPDDAIERVQMKLPEKLLLEFQDKYRDVRLPGYSGLPDKRGEFQYDYKWSKTHGVAFDNEHKPWLIQVSSKVYAMPLPIIPITADPKFHQYVQEELGDPELLEVLETFGAFPSGECFPEKSDEFQQWLRAGVIIEICDTADFMQHMGMFTGCGWSFNSPGIAAYNTGWRFDEKGIIECSTFRLHLELQATDKHYGTNKISPGNELNAQDQSRLAKYLSALFSAIPVDQNIGRAIRYKIRHIDKAEILERAENVSEDMTAEVEYWDQYICSPIANHKGKVHKLYTGKLYHHAKPPGQPQIKFPEFAVGMCVSFDFTPAERGVSAECDTVMYAYFDDDVLKVVKYFYTAKAFKKNVDTDFEECMTVGSWYWNESVGESTVSGHFYLTDIDDRDEISVSTIETTVKGEDKGYDSKPSFSFIHFFAMQGTMWRNRYFTHLTKTKQVNGKRIEIALLIPMFNRNTVLHANRTSSQSESYSEGLELKSIRDPYSYRYWTYHAIFAWNTPLNKQTGKPYPKDGNPVWVEIEEYNPSICSDFADQGPWVNGMPSDYGWLIHPNSNEWIHSGGGGAPKVNTYSINTNKPAEITGNLKWVTNDQIITINTKVPDLRYFEMSPDEYGDGMVRSGSKVFLGQTNYANISETNDAGFWKYTGYSNLVNHSRAYHFIGVINE